MRKIYTLIILIVVLAGIYFSGLYTYFIRTEVQEALPLPSTASEMSVLGTGSFGEVDFIHKGSGQAKLIEVDGAKTLRLENFNVTSGPDLYVYLTKTDKPTGDVKSLGDFIDSGRLKGTMGNQNYAIIGDITGYRTAVIWCKKYGILFTYAVMR